MLDFTFPGNLDRCALALERIASALERMAPMPLPLPLPDYLENPAANPQIYQSETAEEYESRMFTDQQFGLAYGVVPGTSAFDKLKQEYLDELKFTNGPTAYQTEEQQEQANSRQTEDESEREWQAVAHAFEQASRHQG